ncbi:MAG: c-type cytochrome [Candidatus Binataceae bacterium]
MRKGILPLVGLMIAVASRAGASDLTRATHVAHGRAIYQQYCASCHGLTGEGDGPMARVLNSPPANLRLLSERYGNPLPEKAIAQYIDGRVDVKAHGPRDMPVWGKRFYPTAKGSESEIKAMISDLAAYLQSIQIGPRSASRN